MAGFTADYTGADSGTAGGSCERIISTVPASPAAR
jgi:hypothetical protein